MKIKNDDDDEKSDLKQRKTSNGLVRMAKWHQVFFCLKMDVYFLQGASKSFDEFDLAKMRTILFCYLDVLMVEYYCFLLLKVRFFYLLS